MDATNPALLSLMTEICKCPHNAHSEACMQRLANGLACLITGDHLLMKGLSLLLKTISELPQGDVRPVVADLSTKLSAMMQRNVIVALGPLFGSDDKITAAMVSGDIIHSIDEMRRRAPSSN